MNIKNFAKSVIRTTSRVIITITKVMVKAIGFAMLCLGATMWWTVKKATAFLHWFVKGAWYWTMLLIECGLIKVLVLTYIVLHIIVFGANSRR